MILGMSIPAFTMLHVVISLVAIVSGFLAVFALLSSKRSSLTALFLATTTLTSVTGFMFPFKGMTPGIVLGILSMIVLLLAVVALYGAKLAGAWRGVYVISACLALYFNVFVLFAQSFAKLAPLHALAPTQSSPAFGGTQLVLLILFAVLTVRAFKRFRSAAA